MRQIAALPIITSSDGESRVVLITSRGSGRWIIPKGNPIFGLLPCKTAEREAFEEAGLIGHVSHDSVGSFSFARNRHGRAELCTVDVYLMLVEACLQDWPEREQRNLLHCEASDAASLVASEGLAALIRRHAGTLRPVRQSTSFHPAAALV